MFINAVRLVTMDDGFNLRTEPAREAHLTAGRLLKFFEANEKAVEDFASNLLKYVRFCCTTVHPACTSLDFEESNVLQYCGGYLIRSLKKKK